MNDNEIKNCLDNVSSLWGRVTGEAEDNKKAPGDVRETLAGLIDLENINLAELEALAEKTAGRAAATLKALAKGCSGRIKALQAEYFIASGDSAAPQKPGQSAGSVAEKLRAAYLRAGELAEEYMLRSAGGVGKGLSELCYNFSLRLGEEQKRLYAMLRRMF